MKILTGNQISGADGATIRRECISRLELMERASEEIARWLAENVDAGQRLIFCCGKGGNGGDGLAAARMLSAAGRECVVFFGADYNGVSEEVRANMERLPSGVEIYDITSEQPEVETDAVIVDALSGAGFKGEVREPARSIIRWINSLPNRVIAIDVPSGMATEWDGVGVNASVSAPAPAIDPAVDPAAALGPDAAIESAPVSSRYASSDGEKPVVRAETTLTLEFPKLPLLLPGTGEYAGNIVVLPVGLDEEFIAGADTPYRYITEEMVEGLRLPRAKFSHKGDYGHALLVCGSASMPGAAILATGGALRSGCGLVTVHTPRNGSFALAANHPSAMLSLDGADCFSSVPADLGRFSAIGVGCGLGRDAVTVDALGELLARVASLSGDLPGEAPVQGASPFDIYGKLLVRGALSSPDASGELPVSGTPFSPPDAIPIPVVLDADALNIIAANPRLMNLIPAGSVLTPHPGELRRLVGEWACEAEKLEKASALARRARSTVVVKGAHSAVCTPDGVVFFNSTGTPGLAKGGSGDVLTGLVTGLIARGYSAPAASIVGVYTHGRAGEKAAEYYGVEAMNSADLAEFL